jgi:TRAP-type mannitol/chloroaromatic compound transport system permease small subunit
VHAWLRCAHAIDALNERIGRGVTWLAVAMVLVGASNAVARYAGLRLGVRLSSNAYIELQWYLSSLLFLLAAAYTLKHDRHVRVDVFYARWPARVRAWVDLLGIVFFLVPFCVAGLWVSWPAVRRSWAILERSPDPGGLPRYPIKAAILLGFLLLLLQGIAEGVRRIAYLRGAAASPAAEREPRHREML